MNDEQQASVQRKPTLYIVIPCYNEEEVLPVTAPLFRQKLLDLQAAGKIGPASKVLFVNDGSRDSTWDIICDLAASESEYEGLCLSRNRGHQNALLAGLMDVRGRCDITISIDCDGQDDINAMDQMVDAYLDGCDVVYGVRSSRETDTAFKRVTAQSFYRLMERMGVETIYNHADYRLMSARALDAFADLREVNLFLRGMVPLIGFQSCNVYYKRAERFAGESKYPLKKMLAFAINGITSFSTKPLKMITWIGVLMSCISICAFIWAFIVKLTGHSELGWSSTMCSIWLIGGLQLLALGIIGEYVGKIYAEVKQRPRYIIADFINQEASSDDFADD